MYSLEHRQGYINLHEAFANIIGSEGTVPWQWKLVELRAHSHLPTKYKI